MNSVFLDDLKELGEGAQSSPRSSGPVELRAVAFFDLSGSTELKVRHGHQAGVSSLFQHNQLAAEITKRLRGKVVKEMGDGLLCEFTNPVNACLAALNLKKAATQILGLVTNAGLTVGPVERIPVRGRRDIFGATVDRAGRVQSLARGGQILIDQTYKSTVHTLLHDFPEIRISQPSKVFLRGIGNTEVMEITTHELGFANQTQSMPVPQQRQLRPVRHATFPDRTAPENWLVCDKCGHPISPDGHDGIFVVYEGTKTIRAVGIYHKSSCDPADGQGWGDLSELANPQLYVQFVINLFRGLARTNRTIEAPQDVERILWGMYRSVFRTSSMTEQLRFDKELASEARASS